MDTTDGGSPNKPSWKKFKELREQMLKMTGAPAKPMPKSKWWQQQNMPFDPSKLSSNLSSAINGSQKDYYSTLGSWEQIKTDPIVVFFGFNGLVAQKYSLIPPTISTMDEINARMQFAGQKVPWCIKEYDEFMDLVRMFENSPNALKEIEFEEALNIIRANIDMSKGYETFEDAEVDEFDDTCVEACKPGDHACGKKK